MERMNQKTYLDKYINSDYYKQTSFESKIYENWLSDEELDEFEKASQSEHIYYVHDVSMAPESERLGLGPAEEHTTAHYYIFDRFYDNPQWANLVDIIQPKLEATFGNDIVTSHIHVLDSKFPYGLHNDAEQQNMVLAPNPAWTLIVPLADYPSKTYVFNERSGYKDPWSWIHNTGQTPGDYCIDEETWKKDFDPFTEYELMKYLTVQCTFPWKRGSCFAADRFNYHCSDNYYNYGLKSKKAIIMWTSIK